MRSAAGLGGLFLLCKEFRVRRGHGGSNRVASCPGIGIITPTKDFAGQIPFIYIATVERALASRLAIMSLVIAAYFLK